MKKRTTRLVALLLVFILAFGAVGCGNKDKKTDATPTPDATATEAPDGDATDAPDDGDQQAGTEPGWKQHADDKVKLTWYINFSWFTGGVPWGENLVSKTITEETGIDIEFVVPAGNEADKLNSLIAGDSLPDLITLGWWEPQIREMIDAGMVLALDELANENDPYFFEVADKNRVAYYTEEDGHIYQYPNSSYSPADYEKYDNIASNITFVVRKDLYEGIGSPDMTTTEGFIAAVKAAVEKYPEINGQPIIPIGFHEFTTAGCESLDKQLQQFLAIPYETEDGKAYDKFTDPEYVRWLKAFRQLGADGLLVDDVFIDKRAQMEEKIAQGRYFCMMYQRTDFADQQKQLFANDPNSIYMAIDGPKNSNGSDYKLEGGGIAGWTTTLISSKCARPDRAIQLISYLISEQGQLMTWLGVEGTMWDYDANGVPKRKQEMIDLCNSDRAAYDKQYGAESCYWMFQDNAMAGQWAEPLQAPLGQLEEWTYPYANYVGQYAITFAADSPEAIADQKIKQEWSTTLPKLLLASSDEEFDKIFDEYLKKRDSYGFDIVQEATTNQIAANKAKLGMEN